MARHQQEKENEQSLATHNQSSFPGKVPPAFFHPHASSGHGSMIPLIFVKIYGNFNPDFTYPYPKTLNVLHLSGTSIAENPLGT